MGMPMSHEASDDFDLTRLLVEAIEECCQRGMKPPFIMCGISPNGSIISARMDTGGEAEFLAEHYEEEGFRLPMTIVIIDQANDAARIAVTPSGTSWH
jgi:hypothetical protein